MSKRTIKTPKGTGTVPRSAVTKAAEKATSKRSATKKKMTKVLGFDVVLTEEEEGGFSIECPKLPGCISQGETEKEAIENIKDAIELYLECVERNEIEVIRDKFSKAKYLGKCVICNGNTWTYEVIEIDNKIVCSGCGEAIYYAFRKYYLSEDLSNEQKDWIDEMERRLKEGVRTKEVKKTEETLDKLHQDKITVKEAAKALNISKDEVLELADEYQYIPTLEEVREANKIQKEGYEHIKRMKNDRSNL